MAGPQAGDKVTLWYQKPVVHQPGDHSRNPTTDQALWWQGSVASTDQALWWQGKRGIQTMGQDRIGHLFVSRGIAGTARGVASNVAAQINASDPNCSCTTGGAYGNEIFIALRSGEYGPVAVFQL